MLKITLEDGRKFELEPHRPPGMVQNTGDSWGNGSIDWQPDGLFLHEIAEKIGEGARTIAAIYKGEYITLDTFIDENCTLRLIFNDEPDGLAIIAETAKFMVNYAMFQMRPQYEILESKSPMLCGYTVPEGAAFTEEDVEKLNKRLQRMCNQNVEVRTYLMNYVKATQTLFKQGQKTQARTLAAQSLYLPLRIHDAFDYVQVAGEMPLLPMKDMKQLRVASCETLEIIGEPILVLSTIMEYEEEENAKA